MFILLSVLALCFLSELSPFFNIRQCDKSCFTCNIIPNNRALFPFFKPSNKSAPANKIKQARFYKPCIYDKQLGFNKTAVVIGDSLFAVFRHLCFNDFVRYAPHPFKVGFRNKHTANRRRSSINKHLSKIIVFMIRQRKIIRPQTTRINIIRILHPFTSKIIIMPTVNNTNLGFPPCF